MATMRGFVAGAAGSGALERVHHARRPLVKHQTPAQTPTLPPAQTAPSVLRRLRAFACVLLGAAMLMSTAIAGGRPSMFFDTDGYYLMGENLTQAIKRLPAAWAGDPKAMTTPVSDDDQIDIAIMGSRSPWYGLPLYVLVKLGGVWALVAAQALLASWIVYLAWRSAAPTAPWWSYPVLMAGLTLATPLPFFTTFVMPDVFAGVAAVGFVLLTVYAERLSWLERAGVFALLAFSYVVHTSHMLTALAALVPALIVLLLLKAPRRQALVGIGLGLGAIVASVLMAKAYDAAFEMRTGHALHRPPFLMARVLADGPGRTYMRKVCKGPDNPYVICRATQAPLTRSDDILWEETPTLGAFNSLKVPALQLRMEAEEMAFVKGAVLNDPWGQFKASMGNWIDQFTRISSHDPLRDPRQFLANEYWKTTRLVDLIPNPRACRPIGPGCTPPFDMSLTKHWHELVLLLCALYGGWRLSRPDVLADLKARSWTRPSVPLIAAGAILIGMVVLNAGVCGVLSGAFARYQARIVWLVPLTVGLMILAIGPGFTVPRRRASAKAA